MFKLPMREIKRKYTKSELAVLAWRSQELAHNMSQHSKRASRQPFVGAGRMRYQEPPTVDDVIISSIEKRLGPIADKITGDDGDVDLHRLTGAEAHAFFSSLGVGFGAIGPTIALYDQNKGR